MNASPADCARRCAIAPTHNLEMAFNESIRHEMLFNECFGRMWFGSGGSASERFEGECWPVTVAYRPWDSPEMPLEFVEELLEEWDNTQGDE